MFIAWLVLLLVWGSVRAKLRSYATAQNSDTQSVVLLMLYCTTRSSAFTVYNTCKPSILNQVLRILVTGVPIKLEQGERREGHILGGKKEEERQMTDP
jgi:hypothetical protein